MAAIVAATLAGSLTAGYLLERSAHHHSDGRAAPGDACQDAWAHQQDATRFAAATQAARTLTSFQSWLPVGTLPAGLCLETDTELDDAEWAVSSIVLSASGRGDEGPVTYTRTAATAADEDSHPLYVPLVGCVRVTGTITAIRHRADGRASTRATWTAAGTYGRGCRSAPHGGAYQGDDGMLTQR